MEKGMNRQRTDNDDDGTDDGMERQKTDGNDGTDDGMHRQRTDDDGVGDGMNR